MTRAALIFALVVAACAPSQQRLLAGRHYAEALRGVEEGGVDGAAVLAAIERDLQVGLHMQAVGAAALRAQLPGAPPQLDDLVFVRVSHDANLVPISGHELSLSLLHRDDLLPPIAADRPTLAAIFAETLPQAVVTVTPGTRRYKPIGPLELLGRVVVNVVTVGLIHSEIPIFPSEQVGGSVATTQPTEVDYRGASPISEHLYQWLQSPACAPGLLCRYHVLWPRPQVGGEAPLELAVSLAINADPNTAILYRFALPAGSLEGALAAMFGDRMRTLDELQRRYGRNRIAVYPIDVLERQGDGFTPASRARLARIILGTRKRPGLRARPGLRIRLDPAALYGDSNKQIAELRIFLMGLGLTDSQIEIRPRTDTRYGHWVFMVQYELPPRMP